MMGDEKNVVTVDKEIFEKLVKTVAENNEKIKELKETIDGIDKLLTLIGTTVHAI